MSVSYTHLANIAENQKQEAVDEMIALTDLTERETAAEILLETRGYADAVVTITDESADVVVGMSVLSDAQCAQIEDIHRNGIPYHSYSWENFCFDMFSKITLILPYNITL